MYTEKSNTRRMGKRALRELRQRNAFYRWQFQQRDRPKDNCLGWLPYTKVHIYPGEIAQKQRTKQHRIDHPIPSFPDWLDWVIEIQDDPYADWIEIKDNYGELSDRPSDWRVENFDKECYNDPAYLYFHPSYSYEDRFDSWHRYGYSRAEADHLARQGVYEEYNTLRQFYTGYRSMLLVTVKAVTDQGEVIDFETTSADNVGSSISLAPVVEDLKLDILYRLTEAIKDRIAQHLDQVNTLVDIL